MHQTRLRHLGLGPTGNRPHNGQALQRWGPSDFPQTRGRKHKHARSLTTLTFTFPSRLLYAGPRHRLTGFRHYDSAVASIGWAGPSHGAQHRVCRGVLLKRHYIHLRDCCPTSWAHALGLRYRGTISVQHMSDFCLPRLIVSYSCRLDRMNSSSSTASTPLRQLAAAIPPLVARQGTPTPRPRAHAGAPQ